MSTAQNVDVSTAQPLRQDGQYLIPFDPLTGLPLDYSVFNPKYTNHPATAAFWKRYFEYWEDRSDE